MLARVGLEMACVEAAALGTMARRAEGAAARVARSSEVRIMMGDGEISQFVGRSGDFRISKPN